MATKADLQDWLIAALDGVGGKAHHIKLAEKIWRSHEDDLRESGALFYTWQYDLRWAANRLRMRGVIKPADVSPRGVWELAR